MLEAEAHTEDGRGAEHLRVAPRLDQDVDRSHGRGPDRSGARRPPRAPGPGRSSGPAPTTSDACTRPSCAARGDHRQRRVRHGHRARGAGARLDRRCSTGSPGPWPISISTSTPRRSRPSATGSSTRSTCATPPGGKVTDPDHLAEIEMALLHDAVAQPLVPSASLRARGVTRYGSGRRDRARATDPAGPDPLERVARRHRPHRARLHREPLRAGTLRGGAGHRRRHQVGRRARSSTPTRSCTSG